MSKKINEMDDSYADGAVANSTAILAPAAPAYYSDPAEIPAIKSYEEPQEVAMDTFAPQLITVYSQSISPVAYNPDDVINAFDIVFAVGIQDAETKSTRTYQVVKRIGIDKCKLAEQAQLSTPVSIVEEKKQPIIDTKNWRRLAGLE